MDDNLVLPSMGGPCPLSSFCVAVLRECQLLPGRPRVVLARYTQVIGNEVLEEDDEERSAKEDGVR